MQQSYRLHLLPTECKGRLLQLTGIRAIRPIHVHLVGERFAEFHEHVHFEFAVGVDLALDLLVLGQGLLHAVLGVELRILIVVDVLEHLEGHMDVLHLVLQLVDLLQAADQPLSTARKGDR